jgi:hypothetical protein
VVGDLLVLQLKQLPGCSTNAAQAISDRFGGTLLSLHSSLSGLSTMAAVVSPSPPSALTETSLSLSREGYRG